MENTVNNDKETTEGTQAGATAEAPVTEATDGKAAADAAREEELNKLKGELTESKDKYIRLYSEFENFRRRTAKEKLELTQSANEQLIRAFLPVIDDFERAEKSFKDKNDKELEGFFLIYNKFKKILDQNSVKVMELGPGSEFNADFQEAITQIPAPDEKLKGKVVDVVEKGYILNDKVIRFAKVVVGS
jgi:molecular chaperone GrpE